MKNFLAVIVVSLIINERTYAEIVDFAVNISKPNDLSFTLVSKMKIKILDPDSLTYTLEDAKKIKIADNSIFSSADKKICVTNAEDLEKRL